MSCLLLYAFFGVIPRPLNSYSDVSEHSVPGRYLPAYENGHRGITQESIQHSEHGESLKSRFVSSSDHQNIIWGSLYLLFNGYEGYFPEVKRPGRKLNHSPPSSAKVKNKWSCTSNPFVCLQLYLSFLTRNIPRITFQRLSSSMYNVGGILNKYEYWALVELCWQRKIEVPGKKPTHCHFVHQKFHNELAGIERGFRRWQADD
jgi:hypothetical protein